MIYIFIFLMSHQNDIVTSIRACTFICNVSGSITKKYDVQTIKFTTSFVIKIKSKVRL